MRELCHAMMSLQDFSPPIFFKWIEFHQSSYGTGSLAIIQSCILKVWCGVYKVMFLCRNWNLSIKSTDRRVSERTLCDLLNFSWFRVSILLDIHSFIVVIPSQLAIDLQVRLHSGRNVRLGSSSKVLSWRNFFEWCKTIFLSIIFYVSVRSFS